MDGLIGLRLGRCRPEGEAVQGFAAASALAATGKLLDMTQIFINARSSTGREYHRGYGSESVLSTTLPILAAHKDFNTVIYLTSRAFSYSDLYFPWWMDTRAKKGLRTVAIRHTVDDAFDIMYNDRVSTESESDARRVVADYASRPMCCIVCDWPDVPLYEELRSSVTVTMWWYPMRLQRPLESTVPGESTSYYARVFSGASDYCVVVGGYGRLREASEVVSADLSRKWSTFNALLQSQTCAGGICFSCAYLRGCLRNFTGENDDNNESDYEGCDYGPFPANLLMDL